MHYTTRKARSKQHVNEIAHWYLDVVKRANKNIHDEALQAQVRTLSSVLWLLMDKREYDMLRSINPINLSEEEYQTELAYKLKQML